MNDGHDNIGILVHQQAKEGVEGTQLDQFGIVLGHGRGDVELLNVLVELHLRVHEAGRLCRMLDAELLVFVHLLLQGEGLPLQGGEVKLLHRLRDHVWRTLGLSVGLPPSTKCQQGPLLTKRRRVPALRTPAHLSLILFEHGQDAISLQLRDGGTHIIALESGLSWQRGPRSGP